MVKRSGPGVIIGTKGNKWPYKEKVSVPLAISIFIYIAVIYNRPAINYALSDLAITEYINLISFGVVVLALAIKSRGFGFHVPNAAIVLLAVASGSVALSTLASAANLSSFIRVMYLVFATWLTYVIFSEIGRRDKGADVVMASLAVCATFNAVIGIWGMATGRLLFDQGQNVIGVGSFGFDASSGRTGGIVGENYVGLYNLPCMLAGLWFVFIKKYRGFGSLLVALYVVSVIVSFSRSSTTTAIAAIILFLVAWRRRGYLRLLFGSAILLSCVIAFAPWLVSNQLNKVEDRVARVISMRWSSSGIMAESRLDLWESYFVKAIQKPFVGHGPYYLESQVSMGDQLPHNSYVDVVVEYGIYGLITYIAAMIVPLTLLYPVIRGYDVDARLAILVVCFWAMFTSLMTLSNPLLRVIWIVAGTIAGLSKSLRRAPSSRLGIVK